MEFVCTLIPASFHKKASFKLEKGRVHNIAHNKTF